MHKLATTLTGILFISASAVAADLTKEELKAAASAHPCIDKVSIPWSVSIAKNADIPAQFKSWAPYAIVGIITATETKEEMCNLVLIKSIRENGWARVTYMTGAPLNRTFDIEADVKANGPDEQVLTINFVNNANIVYTLKNNVITSTSYGVRGAGTGTHAIIGPR